MFFVGPGDEETGMSSTLIKADRIFKRLGMLFLHVLIVALAFFLAFYFRFDLSIPEKYRQVFLIYLPTLILIKIVVFWKMGLVR